MAEIRLPVPDLIQGISQRDRAHRDPGSADVLENFLPDPARGLSRRPPTEHKRKLFVDTPLSTPFAAHWIDRSTNERYVVIMYHQDLKVFGSDGIEYEVYDQFGNIADTTDFAYLGVQSTNQCLDPENMNPGLGNWSLQGAATTWTLTGVSAPYGAGQWNAINHNLTGNTGYLEQTIGVFSDVAQVFSVFTWWDPTAAGFDNLIDRFMIGIYDATDITLIDAQFDWVDAQLVPSGGVAVNEGVYTSEIVGYQSGNPIYRVSINLTKANVLDFFLLSGNTRKVRWGAQSGTAPTKAQSNYAWGAHFIEGVSVAPDYVGDIDNLGGLTVADYTLVYNKSVAVKQGSTVADTIDSLYSQVSFDGTPTDVADIALVYVRQGADATDYTVTWKLVGSAEQSVTVDTTVLTSFDTVDIAQDLATKIDAATANVEPTLNGSSIGLAATAAFEYIRTSDGLGDTGLVSILRSVESVDSLPKIAIESMRVQIGGVSATTVDLPETGYFAKFVPEGSSYSAGELNMGPGRWEEATDYGVIVDLDETTMPHQLVRMQDDAAGTVTGNAFSIYFEFGPVAWIDREVGDDTTNPFPTFVSDTDTDKFVQGMAFVQNRLAIVHHGGLVLSEVARYFNVFRTTVRTVVDSDTIDAAASHTRVVEMKHAAPIEGRLFGVSDRTQFVIEGQPLLSPASISFTPASEHGAVVTAEPAVSRRGIYLGIRLSENQFNGLRELYAEEFSEKIVGTDLTGHVPELLAGKMLELSRDPSDEYVSVLCDGSRNKVYLLRRAFVRENPNTLAQASWCELVLDSGDVIIAAGFVGTELWFVIRRSDGIYLDSCSLDLGISDSSVNWRVHLDRRFQDFTSLPSYDSGTGLTTFNWPYDIPTSVTPAIVHRSGSTAPFGTQLTLNSVDRTVSGSHFVTVTGDVSGGFFYGGLPYTSKLRPARPQIRTGSDPRVALLLDSQLNLESYRLRHEDAMGYRVETTAPDGSTKLTYTMTPATALTQEEGVIRAEVHGLADDVVVEVLADGIGPCRLTSALWYGREERT